ncbi:putative 2-aminoethylphosphonate ABC transporter substrate-binding protein [Aneurinibacillus thermoaerophilus]|uniref:2-aminoethylphosphonate ABC transporter substrate-binding protein n=1 Tax=Aneurinibacillus thermoaerophilus TaxID=143495 RepID=A0ABX8Y6M3_ANETH|nr:putative 2-aminoethylphosphonate ABC transporter substrate-binding protein [Aneurinibacillus thermoaerophilus]MED0675919.1 putative 2-aminoethylphosphonate ABC transporter substrate-binding protein [Aneurinibacillus thermoaerophilus]MED0677806.1 putative 2-aminoethylphosphonate ABC transporter substrate-binding protein [Aneurinibacillus thermoaerophilus]MED0737555.1 putative 2-aminoethylphosphonate ABC transporter substrate-binding protein [Aneurinibacillus thermoaerophilus]MED0758126.1 puta
MKRWSKLLLVMTLLLLAILTGCGGGKATTGEKTQGNGEGKAKELTIYTALEDDQIQTYLESFKKKYPDIKLNIVRDSTGVITAKLLAEKENPQADVVWGTAATSLLVLDQNQMLEGYSPKGIERIVPQFKDKAEPAHWVGIDAWETAIIVNTKELEKRKLPIPQTYADLIKPEYKGLIVMPNPSSSGTGFLTVSGLHQLLGEQKAWEYMDKLHENIALYTHSGSKPAKMAAQGEYPIGISFGYRGITEKKKGAPVEVVFPKEGSGWDLEANALVKKKEIKPEAKLFLDWAISGEAMKEYNKNFAIVSVKNEGQGIPEGYTQDPLKQLIPYDFNKAATERDKILAEWDKRYSAKSEPKK